MSKKDELNRISKKLWLHRFTSVEAYNQGLKDAAEVADISYKANMADPVTSLIVGNIAQAIRDKIVE